MPTINLGKKKYRLKTNDDNFKYVYNTRKWKKIRLWYLSQHPLCELCEKKDKISLAEEVHHKQAISKGKTKEEKQQLGFNIGNLQSLCKPCHKEITVKEIQKNNEH